jgi:hypothetical protein
VFAPPLTLITGFRVRSTRSAFFWRRETLQRADVLFLRSSSGSNVRVRRDICFVNRVFGEKGMDCGLLLFTACTRKAKPNGAARFGTTVLL